MQIRILVIFVHFHKTGEKGWLFMKYSAELQFLRKTFASCKLQTLILPPDKSKESRMDLGMRSLIGWTRDYELTLIAAVSQCRPRTLYRMTDQFGYCYQFLQLPGEGKDVLWIGPYFDQEITHETLLFFVERYEVDPRWVPPMERFFSQIPILPDNNPIHAMVYQFCTLIWGSGDFDTIDLNRELTGHFAPIEAQSDISQPEDVLREMKLLEHQYRYENELLFAVSQGLIQKGSVMIGQLSSFNFEQRTPDAMRNMKNYCIIMNTLLRKAAEQGGVHPIYLHRLSSDYAKRIEQAYNGAAINALMREMFYGYCRLVNRHATEQYSLPVQRVIAYIDTDLTADLSLHTLAETQNLSSGYLSALFKKETGQTLTAYVNRRRIRRAIRLLNSTNLQIQAIARGCGYTDVNYFSKVFKKQVGQSPLEYRKTLKIDT